MAVIILWLIMIVLAFACWRLPLLLQIIILVANIYLPDPLPLLDELIQLIGILGRIMSLLGIGRDD